ncbi:hypothetical protein H920_18739 [Fukomys damarensis]|uniref:Uncharacterized protein n=1 Tax=Fukomys damarensis TaxID=885580 RepID=A0A091CPC5_FUKDA|nr:hypothetical protein H920_18739 [Fukomys damarensis]
MGGKATDTPDGDKEKPDRLQTGKGGQEHKSMKIAVAVIVIPLFDIFLLLTPNASSDIFNEVMLVTQLKTYKHLALSPCEAHLHLSMKTDQKILTASEDPNAQEMKDIYGLCSQIKRKVAFLRSQMPKDLLKLILTGHAVSSGMVLQILKYAPELPFPYALYVSGYLLLKPYPDTVIGIVLRVINLKTEFILRNVIQPCCLINAAYFGAQHRMTTVKRDDDIKRNIYLSSWTSEDSASSSEAMAPSPFAAHCDLI